MDVTRDESSFEEHKDDVHHYGYGSAYYRYNLDIEVPDVSLAEGDSTLTGESVSADVLHEWQQTGVMRDADGSMSGPAPLSAHYLQSDHQPQYLYCRQEDNGNDVPDKEALSGDEELDGTSEGQANGNDLEIFEATDGDISPDNAADNDGETIESGSYGNSQGMPINAFPESWRTAPIEMCDQVHLQYGMGSAPTCSLHDQYFVQSTTSRPHPNQQRTHSAMHTDAHNSVPQHHGYGSCPPTPVPHAQQIVTRFHQSIQFATAPGSAQSGDYYGAPGTAGNMAYGLPPPPQAAHPSSQSTFCSGFTVQQPAHAVSGGASPPGHYGESYPHASAMLGQAPTHFSARQPEPGCRAIYAAYDQHNPNNQHQFFGPPDSGGMPPPPQSMNMGSGYSRHDRPGSGRYRKKGRSHSQQHNRGGHHGQNLTVTQSDSGFRFANDSSYNVMHHTGHRASSWHSNVINSGQHHRQGPPASMGSRRRRHADRRSPHRLADGFLPPRMQSLSHSHDRGRGENGRHCSEPPPGRGRDFDEYRAYRQDSNPQHGKRNAYFRQWEKRVRRQQQGHGGPNQRDRRAVRHSICRRTA